MAVKNDSPEGAGIVSPGGTIGILGGGQLGRMTALAAANLGYRCHIYCPDPESPASQVTPLNTVAAYEDQAALDAFADSVDVVTYEFENVPPAAAQRIAARTLLRPGARVLETCRNRLKEKTFCQELGIPTTRFWPAEGPRDVAAALAEAGGPAVLKTTELGYDGKGQVALKPDSDAEAAWSEMTGSPVGAKPLQGPGGIVEAFVDFALEISVIVARGPSGQAACFPAVENRHRNHILDETRVPAPVAPGVAERAQAIALTLAEGLELVGLLGVEMFVTPKDEVLVNELAPRPHNSGHWTMDACRTSQFEQFVRAVTGQPLGSTEALGRARMKNLLGDECLAWHEILTDPKAKLHLYGKAEPKPGRKMGHVNYLLSRD